MTEFLSLAAGVILLVGLLLAVAKGWLASRPATPAGSELDATESCPEELVSRVFGREDWEFVRGVRAQNIEELFKQERKKVALLWVQQTSASIRNVMREHAQATRRSKNLKVSTEIKIVGQFLIVLAACGILSVSIRIAGPLWLGGLAQFAQRLALQVTRFQESFGAVILAKPSGESA